MAKSFENNSIDYEHLVHTALRDVVKSILKDAAQEGLPGDHHFYISFATPHPMVQLPDYLHEEYPEDMTIVIQHEFWDLEVGDTSFSVTLCFDEIHERIVIPYDAIVSFVDPSVKFGVQFSPVYPEDMPQNEPVLSSPGSEKTLQIDEQTTLESNVIAVDFSKRK
jgi:hypothetical protein